MTDHMQLIENAITAIQKVHSDTSVSLQDTLYSLGLLRDEVGMMIDAVEGDIRRQDDAD